MKKCFATLLMLTAVFSLSYGQACEPDMAVLDTQSSIFPNIFPKADEQNSPTSSLPTGCEGESYSTTFHMYLHDSLSVDFNGTLISVDAFSLKIDDIAGLPDSLNVSCNPPDCMIEDENFICILVEGTPVQTGEFMISLRGEIEFTINNSPITDSFEYPYYTSPQQQKEYVITIHPENSTECTVHTNDAFEQGIGLRQNSPNPFANTTNIAIDSKASGMFDFKVYSLIGELVHSKILTLSAGENVFEFDGADLNSGMYFYAVGQGNNVVTKRMVVSK